MRFLIFILFQFLLMVSSRDAFGQKSQVAVPFSVSGNLMPVATFERVSRPDPMVLKNDDSSETAGRLKNRQFAEMIDVDFSPLNSGQWDETGTGRVWRLGITSVGAFSLYEVFGVFRLEKGVKLFVYNPDKSSYAGAFTAENNTALNTFAVAPVTGEFVVLELNVPHGMHNFGELVLTRLGHGLETSFEGSSLKSYGMSFSGDCNVDVNCTEGSAWRNEKDAVSRILVNGMLCTGTLINSAASGDTPYLITASHCVSDAAGAASALFFFGHERPFCNLDADVRSYTISGAELMATTDWQLDFSLLRLHDFPPVGFKPYLAGWDALSEAPESGVTIHHPSGDVKKVSVEKDPLQVDDFGEGFNYNSHWVVSRWEAGATEGGSSGAPFFDAKGRLRGTLSGGDATCGRPDNDFFSRFDLAWDFYPEPSRQLKHWLDPGNTGLSQINGRYLHKAPLQSERIYSNTYGEFRAIYDTNLSWGVLSGHNSSGFSRFSEKFHAPAPMQLSGISMDIRDRFYLDVFSTFQLKVWNGSDWPEEEIYSQEVYIRSLLNNTTNYFYLDSLVNVSGNFFVGFEIDYSLSDSIMVYTSENRGANGASYMYVYDAAWHNINEVTNPPLNTSLAIGVMSHDGIDPSFQASRPLTLIPNPAQNLVKVAFSDDTTGFTVECYDMSGRRFPMAYTKVSHGFVMDTSQLADGLYLLVVSFTDKQMTTKLMIHGR